MCGRIIMVEFDELEAIARAIDLDLPFDVRPGQPTRSNDGLPNDEVPILMVRMTDDPVVDPMATEELEWNKDAYDREDPLADRRIVAARKKWGFETQNRTQVVFNTRIETVDERPLWKDSLEHRRCVVPVRAFYERHASEKGISPRTGRAVKQSYQFTSPEGIMLLAGVWQGDRFSIITTEPNDSVASVHDRMPLILSCQGAREWLLGDWRAVPRTNDIALDGRPLYAPQPTAEQPRLF